jgi:hypothetical protein
VSRSPPAAQPANGKLETENSGDPRPVPPLLPGPLVSF